MGKIRVCSIDDLTTDKNTISFLQHYYLHDQGVEGKERKENVLAFTCESNWLRAQSAFCQGGALKV